MRLPPAVTYPMLVVGALFIGFTTGPIIERGETAESSEG